MIERKFITKNMKEYLIQEYIDKNIKRVGHSHTKLKKTPLGDKIIIFASMPGLVVGRSGANIKKLTKSLKTHFGLENPQIEMSDVENMYLNPRIVAEKIANSLERFGTGRFKGIMHRSMSDVMNAGAKGVEILVTGKVPGARAKRWRVYQGYLKKCGDVAINGVLSAKVAAFVKTGAIGIQVKIMPPNVRLPDEIRPKIVDDEKDIETSKKSEKISEKPKKLSKKPNQVKGSKEKSAPKSTKGDIKSKEESNKNSDKTEEKNGDSIKKRVKE
jgi:small subunit ribosomal protein S3